MAAILGVTGFNFYILKLMNIITLKKVVHRTPPESPPYLHNYILLGNVPPEIDLILVYNFGVFVIGDSGIL